jgi:DUF1680 family protein
LSRATNKTAQFWGESRCHHSYVTGDHSNSERFRLTSSTTTGASGQTYNAYNMLKLTEHVFGWNPNADAAG